MTGFFITIVSWAVLLIVIILISIFIRNVRGRLRRAGYLFILSYILFGIAAFFDHPPGNSLVPENIVIIIPILFILIHVFGFYSFLTIGEQISDYYKQAHICTVHRGKINRNESLYYCPDCNTIYCLNCYEQVIKQDGCWNCGRVDKRKPEKELKEEVVDEEIIIDEKSKVSHKKNKSSKKK